MQLHAAAHRACLAEERVVEREARVRGVDKTSEDFTDYLNLMTDVHQRLAQRRLARAYRPVVVVVVPPGRGRRAAAAAATATPNHLDLALVDHPRDLTNRIVLGARLNTRELQGDDPRVPRRAETRASPG